MLGGRTLGKDLTPLRRLAQPHPPTTAPQRFLNRRPTRRVGRPMRHPRHRVPGLQPHVIHQPRRRRGRGTPRALDVQQAPGRHGTCHARHRARPRNIRLRRKVALEQDGRQKPQQSMGRTNKRGPPRIRDRAGAKLRRPGHRTRRDGRNRGPRSNLLGEYALRRAPGRSHHARRRNAWHGCPTTRSRRRRPQGCLGRNHPATHAPPKTQRIHGTASQACVAGTGQGLRNGVAGRLPGPSRQPHQRGAGLRTKPQRLRAGTHGDCPIRARRRACGALHEQAGRTQEIQRPTPICASPPLTRNDGFRVTQAQRRDGPATFTPPPPPGWSAPRSGRSPPSPRRPP